MMFATVEALREIGGSATIQELDEKVAELEGVTEEEQSYMMTGSNSSQPRLNYYLAWARSGPVTVSCRPKCSFKPPSVRRRQGFSSPTLSVGGADCRSR